jgi:hypothetical protein
MPFFTTAKKKYRFTLSRGTEDKLTSREGCRAAGRQIPTTCNGCREAHLWHLAQVFVPTTPSVVKGLLIKAALLSARGPTDVKGYRLECCVGGALSARAFKFERGAKSRCVVCSQA